MQSFNYHCPKCGEAIEVEMWDGESITCGGCGELLETEGDEGYDPQTEGG